MFGIHLINIVYVLSCMYEYGCTREYVHYGIHVIDNLSTYICDMFIYMFETEPDNDNDAINEPRTLDIYLRGMRI